MLSPRLKMMNYKLLFTALALVLFPRQLTFLSLLTIFLRLVIVIVIPATSPGTPASTPVTAVLDTLANLLLRSTVLVLCLHSSIRIVKMVLLWCAQNIDAILLPAGSWTWICVALGEVVVSVCRWVVCPLLSTSLLTLGIDCAYETTRTR